jgi:signal transduction histidine kinase
VALDVQDVEVSIKPNAFRRLISNLLGNAVRYADNVKVKGGVENRLLTILVDDDGPGIPAENREMRSGPSCGSTMRATWMKREPGLNWL